MLRSLWWCCIVLMGSISLSSAQNSGTNSNMHEGDGMTDHMRHAGSSSLSDLVEQHTISGTDVEPNSTPSEMLMVEKAGWMLMFHGEAFLNAIQQTGARGADKVFSTNWLMPMAQKRTGHGVLTLRAMLSLEPATVTHRQYPELFQQGETAFGKPVIDGQHPHDFLMEVGALYDRKIREDTSLSIYVAPVGAPALGPPAYPHRSSAAEDPLAPLGHHLEDSTHIANDVVTLGVVHKSFRIEASGFHGREPDERRWDLDSGKIDSWATRVTANPGQNWSFQYSVGSLTSPEALAPRSDVRRMTASLIYNRPIHNGNWASMILWGRNQNLQDGNVGNAYLVESTLRFLTRNNVWTRIENVDRTTELLDGTLSSVATDRYFTRVQAYSFGYDRELGDLRHISAALGGQLTAYGVPGALSGIYGSRPMSAVIFLRIRSR